MQHFDYIEKIQQANTLEQARELTAQFAHALGFRNYGYAVQPRLSASTEASRRFLTLHDFVNEWAHAYQALEDHEVQRNDPRVRASRAGLPASAWNFHGQTSYRFGNRNLIQQIKRTTRQAGAFGHACGISVPIWSPNAAWSFLTFTTTTAERMESLTPLVPISVYFAHCLQATIERLRIHDLKIPALTKRECEILRWAAIGKTSWDISTILRISERTVNFHLAQAAAKLQVKGRRAACARAVALGVFAL